MRVQAGVRVTLGMARAQELPDDGVRGGERDNVAVKKFSDGIFYCKPGRDRPSQPSFATTPLVQRSMSNVYRVLIHHALAQ